MSFTKKLVTGCIHNVEAKDRNRMNKAFCYLEYRMRRENTKYAMLKGIAIAWK